MRCDRHDYSILPMLAGLYSVSTLMYRGKIPVKKVMKTIKEKVIELSKIKVALLTLGAILFVALGVWLLIEGIEVFEGSYRFDPIMIVVAVITIFFFSLCAVFGFKKFFDNSPGLILNHEGFIDNSSGVSAGRVPWSEVVEIGQYKIQSQKFITIYVINAEKYVNRGNALKRMANRGNLKLSGTPINISSNSLKISFDELVETFEQYFEWSRNSNK